MSEPVEFLITADIGHEPSSVTVDHVNQRLEEVALSDAAPVEPASVSIRPSFSNEPQILELEIIRPSLKVNVSPKSVYGFGLEEASIIVRPNDLPSINDLPITLSSTKGGLDELSVSTNERGVATTKIRSIGIGTATIRADSPPFTSSEAKLNFSFPWIFILVAVIGGCIGVFAKQKNILKLRLIVAGICLGLIGGVAYAVGVNLTDYTPTAKVGEALTFFIAAILAYGGQIVLPGSKKSGTAE